MSRRIVIGLTLPGLGCMATPGDPRPDPVDEAPAAAWEFVAAPTLTQNPVPAAPLSWRLQATVDRPASVTVAVTDRIDSWVRGPFEVEEQLDVWLMRWHPGEIHTVRIVATDAEGAVAEAELEVVAPPLPADYPDVRVISADPSRMEPGYTVFSPSASSPDAPRYIVAHDENGLPVWWFTLSGLVYGLQRTERGISYIRGRSALFEVDLQGNRIGRWSTEASGAGIQVPITAIHHDAITLPNGHLLALSAEARDVALFPLSEHDPTVIGPAFVAGDVIVELDPATGELLDSWHLLDLLDGDRIGYEVLRSTYWQSEFAEPAEDWSHANALAYDPVTDRIWVSLRHQDAIVAIGRESGELEAILGDNANWDPPWASALFTLTSGTWMYHQHGIWLGPEGSVFAFDNGNYGVSPPLREVRHVVSGAVEYTFDEAARTAAEVWSYVDPRGLFVGEMGNVQHLPGADTVLVNYGAILQEAADDPGIILVEVTHEATPEVVFELAVHPRSTDRGADTKTFRAQRWAEF